MPKTARKPRINPQKVRRTLTWDLDLTEGSVAMRRADLLNLAVTGRIDLPMLRLAERMETGFGLTPPEGGTLTTSDVMAAMSPDERELMVAMFRRYAVAAIADPVYVLEDDGDPSHVPVLTLSVQDLLKVWMSVPPTDVEVDPEQPVALPPTEVAAEEFRVAAGAAAAHEVHRPDPVGGGEAAAVPADRPADPQLVDYAQA